QEMTSEEQEIIQDLDKCDFSEIHKYFVDKSEARKALPKEEKQVRTLSCAIWDWLACFGDADPARPAEGTETLDELLMLRLIHFVEFFFSFPKEAVAFEQDLDAIGAPGTGFGWKGCKKDGALKEKCLGFPFQGEKDWQKYEVARRLKGVVHQIRAQYRADWKSKEMKKRQRAVALYFIDKLALRAGNEKEEGETADTVGCCSLRVEHIKLHPELDGQEHVVEFDFLGKDSIRYYNTVSVEKPVFKNLQRFMKNKDPTDDLFDKLNTTFLNKHLQHLMDGLTAKVFRTYNASITLQEQLKALTNPEDNVAGKLLSYNRANRAVAILCNHQRSVPKTFAKSMENLQAKIDAKKKQVEEAQQELKKAEDEFEDTKDAKAEANVEKKKKLLKKLEEQLARLNVQATDKEENKQIALGTSKLNYLDPRISIAWCKKFGVPIEKIYNKTQREKFAWAIAMADEDFEF
ncbi:TOP1M topoisomerase, partial [Xiphorhynchus elegans]|nr:TOP1M topoisomerase [Xiphorhynchus elegans]